MKERSDDLVSIVQELRDINKRLSNCYKEMWTKSKEYSKAEQEYKVALQKRIMELKADGMSVTLIPDLARGTEHVAELKFKRDLSEKLYDSAKEANRSLRAIASVYQSILRQQDEI